MDYMQPLLSIVLINYNRENLIERMLQSIYNSETKFQFKAGFVELIIVDDCSTDDSIDIIKNFVKIENAVGIRLFRNKKNYHMLRSRLNGIKEAKGLFIWNIDSDDYILNLNNLISIIRENQDSDGIFFNSDGISTLLEYEDVNQHFVWNYIIKKDKIKSDIEIPSLDDFQLFNNLILNENNLKLKFIKEQFYYYVLHKNNETNNYPMEFYKRDEIARHYFLTFDWYIKYYNKTNHFREYNKYVNNIIIYVNKPCNSIQEALKTIKYNLKYIEPEFPNLMILYYLIKDYKKLVKIIECKNLIIEEPINVPIWFEKEFASEL